MTTPELAPQTVQRLVVERFKRLTDVEIVPDATTPTVQITGRNAQGKSSVLDALETVFTGVDRRATPRPIHEGESNARIVAETEDLVITRTFRETARGVDSTLVVAAKTGARYGSPQTMMDELYGEVSADPWAFATMDPRAQRDLLLRYVELPFDLDALERERSTAYAERTEANRQAKEAGVLAARAPVPPADAPTTEQSASELIARLSAAQEHSRLLSEAYRDEARQTERVKQLQQQLELAQADLAGARSTVTTLAAREVEDPEALSEQLDGLEAGNAAARENARLIRERDELVRTWEERKATAEALDARVRQLEQQKADGLAAAQFPVEGLGFNEDGVTYLGQPFQQASTAERIRVSVAVATARPGTIRVLLIRRGESLDQENLALIGALAAEQGFQVWIEAVREERELGVFFMEDGRLAE